MHKRLQLWLSTLPKKKLVGFLAVLISIFALGGYLISQKYFGDENIDDRIAVSGRIFDTTSGKALEGAKVTFLLPEVALPDVGIQSDTTIEATTGDMGNFNITLPAKAMSGRISVVKDGYWDLEGTYFFDSTTSGPKEVSLTLIMDSGFGKQDIHLQTIMPGENYISVPISPTDSNPKTFLKYYTSNPTQKDGYSKHNIPVINKLSRIDKDTKNTILLTDGESLAKFGNIEAGTGYKLKFENPAPQVDNYGSMPNLNNYGQTIIEKTSGQTVLIKGTLPKNGGTISLGKAGKSLIGYPLDSQMGFGEINVVTGDNSIPIDEALAKGTIKNIIGWDSNKQKQILYTKANFDAEMYPGASYWVESISDGIAISFGQTDKLVLNMVSIPIEGLTIDNQLIKIQDVWLLSMHPQAGDVDDARLAYLDKLKKVLAEYQNKYIFDNKIVINQSDIISDYTFNGKSVSDSYAYSEDVSVSSIRPNTASASYRDNMSYEDICAMQKTDAWKFDNAAFSIGNNYDEKLYYYFDSSWKDSKGVLHPLPASLKTYITDDQRLDVNNQKMSVIKYITSNFSEPFARQGCERRILISFDSGIDSWGDFNPSTMEIRINTNKIQNALAVAPTIPYIIPEVYTGIHEILHSIRMYNTSNSWAGSPGGSANSSSFFAYEEGQVSAYNHLIQKAANETYGLANVDTGLYEKVRIAMTNGVVRLGFDTDIDRKKARDQTTKDIKDLYAAAFAPSSKDTRISTVYDYYGKEWVNIASAYPHFFKEFNVRVKNNKNGFTNANAYFDQLMGDKKINNKPFYDWMSPYSRGAFTITTYYNNGLYKKINSEKPKAHKSTPKTSLTENLTKVMQVSGETTKYVIVRYVNALYQSISAIPYTIFSDQGNPTPNQNLKIVYYDFNNNKTTERAYTTNESGDLYPWKYDLINDGRVRYVLSWLRDGKWNIDTMYNASHSSLSNMGIYGIVDIPADGQVNFVGPTNENATISKGFYSLPNSYPNEGDYTLQVNGDPATNDFIFKTFNSDYFKFIQTDFQEPELDGDVTKEVKSDSSVEIKFKAKEEVSGLIGYSADDKFNLVKYFDEVKKDQNPIPDGLALNQKYNYQLLLVDRSVNNKKYEGTFTPFAISGITAVPQANSASITWGTTAQTKVRVCYGETTAYGTCTNLSDTYSAEHTVNLPGLTANTTYHYQVYAETEDSTFRKSGDKTFKTITDTIEMTHSGEWVGDYHAEVSFQVDRPVNATLTWRKSGSAVTEEKIFDAPAASFIHQFDVEDEATYYYYISVSTPIDPAHPEAIPLTASRNGSFVTPTVSIEEATITPEAGNFRVSWRTNIPARGKVKYSSYNYPPVPSFEGEKIEGDYDVSQSVVITKEELLALDSESNRFYSAIVYAYGRSAREKTRFTNGFTFVPMKIYGTSATSRLINPSVQDYDVTFTWGTSLLATGTVDYVGTSSGSASCAISGTTCTATAHNVKPGVYTYTVRANASEGSWPEVSKTGTFTVYSLNFSVSANYQSVASSQYNAVFRWNTNPVGVEVRHATLTGQAETWAIDPETLISHLYTACPTETSFSGIGPAETSLAIGCEGYFYFRGNATIYDGVGERTMPISVTPTQGLFFYANVESRYSSPIFSGFEKEYEKPVAFPWYEYGGGTIQAYRWRPEISESHDIMVPVLSIGKLNTPVGSAPMSFFRFDQITNLQRPGEELRSGELVWGGVNEYLSSCPGEVVTIYTSQGNYQSCQFRWP